jgi:proteasome accessory factor B
LLARADATADLVLAEKRPARDYRGRAEAIRALVDAIDRRETVNLEYRKLGERKTKQRLVDPYHLHIHAGALYLIGWCHERQAPRTFLLDRASHVEPTSRKFQRRADLALSSVLQGDLGPWSGAPETIRLRFTSVAARLVAERKVHPSQVTEPRLDGSIDVTLTAPITPWLEHWLTGWAADVTVLSPAHLRASIRRRHQDVLKIISERVTAPVPSSD